MFERLISFAVGRPRWIVGLTMLVCVLALAQYPAITVDTDPENMLPDDAPVRVFHHQTKKEFGLYDFIVLGIVNERDPSGVFNPTTLKATYQITQDVKQVPGVIAQEIIALSTKDNIEQAGPGSVRFNWLMEAPPKTGEEALKIRDEAMDHPMFKDSVVSADGKALAIFIPIEKKDISYEVSREVAKIAGKYLRDGTRYYITGLPVAEDQFGVEMFKQMAVSAPMAGVVIFLLMWFFFKSARLVVAPMIVAVVTVVVTMGLLIGFRFPVHIMSSMIPIFLMPIAVLDSVHILSEFFDKYPRFQDRQKTIVFVLKELFSPMLFTSLTSAVGFFSLSFSPIPPVQVFGVFVAVGILFAWLLTIALVPAYVMFMKEEGLRGFGHTAEAGRGSPLIDGFLTRVKTVCLRRYRAVLLLTVFLAVVSIYGLTRIEVNDNPVRWFQYRHPIRVADRVLNRHFAGTYEAYLVLEAKDKQGEVFLRPEMLRYLERFQKDMTAHRVVGKITSLADIVKKVYDELMGGDKTYDKIPPTKAAVAQSLLSFENSHKPDDLWHMTTPDYAKVNIWFALKSGDNKDMTRVAEYVRAYFRDNPPPFEVKARWAGLTYINVVWQDNMVKGMLKNFLGSFVIVFFMMVFLFKSPVRAAISMIPLTVTILFIYGLLGFVGKDYDMPVAVLSALTLGLSIDFAIHFIQRAREVHKEVGDGWGKVAEVMFTGPGRAIIRNAIVVAVGFLPLLAAPLVPYKTVGFFMFAIMTISGLATLFILPSMVSWKPGAIFGRTANKPETDRKGGAS